jgi:hypothetical protein
LDLSVGWFSTLVYFEKGTGLGATYWTFIRRFILYGHAAHTAHVIISLFKVV